AALTVRVIHLRPARDTRFDQVPKMIKRDSFLIAFGAFAPLRAWTNQADVSFERVPKLRQLVEPKFPQPAPPSCPTTLVFSCLIALVRFMGAFHCSKFEKDEPFAVTADSFLPEKDGTAVLHPDEKRDKQKERSANDQCYCRSKDIEEAFEIMIWGVAGQLKT